MSLYISIAQLHLQYCTANRAQKHVSELYRKDKKWLGFKATSVREKDEVWGFLD